jgi:hypothetical protein
MGGKAAKPWTSFTPTSHVPALRFRCHYCCEPVDCCDSSNQDKDYLAIRRNSGDGNKESSCRISLTIAFTLFKCGGPAKRRACAGVNRKSIANLQRGLPFPTVKSGLLCNDLLGFSECGLKHSFCLDLLVLFHQGKSTIKKRFMQRRLLFGSFLVPVPTSL